MRSGQIRVHLSRIALEVREKGLQDEAPVSKQMARKEQSEQETWGRVHLSCLLDVEEKWRRQARGDIWRRDKREIKSLAHR